MFLLIDNFDSFTFNVVQAFQQLGHDPVVLKNDDPEILKLAASGTLEKVCISPGPSNPSFHPPMVTVTSERTVWPLARPVSAHRPLGRSMERMVARDAFTCFTSSL